MRFAPIYQYRLWRGRRPMRPQERSGTVANVVLPTGIGRRDDLGSPDRFDVYYGMADNRIGVAGGVADSPGAEV
jgi:predicted GH43/DUF377 family glycosyl hydrolase